jgi:hypothetical protein
MIIPKPIRDLAAVMLSPFHNTVEISFALLNVPDADSLEEKKKTGI